MHKKKAGKLQTGITFPKQYWLAVNGKPKRAHSSCVLYAYHKYEQILLEKEGLKKMGFHLLEVIYGLEVLLFPLFGASCCVGCVFSLRAILSWCPKHDQAWFVCNIFSLFFFDGEYVLIPAILVSSLTSKIRKFDRN